MRYPAKMLPAGFSELRKAPANPAFTCPRHLIPLSSNWGAWSATGKHQFGGNLGRRRPEYQGTEAQARTLDGIEHQFRVEFARITAAESGHSTEDIGQAMAEAEREPKFTTRLDRRVRHWTDGVIIGSKTFVLETASAFRQTPDRHRLGKIAAGDLFSWTRLRRAA